MMSGNISFSDKQEHSWVVAGWAYRQILEDVISHCPEDSEIVHEATLATETGYLMVESLEPGLAARITNVIREVTTGILSGAIRPGIHDKPYGTAHTVEQYRQGLQELLETIPSNEGPRNA